MKVKYCVSLDSEVVEKLEEIFSTLSRSAILNNALIDLLESEGYNVEIIPTSLKISEKFNHDNCLDRGVCDC